VKLQREQDITAGIPTDIAVVSPTEILACDYVGKTVALVDSIRGDIVATVLTPGRPRSLCVLREGILAVSLEGKKVQFIKVGRGALTLDHVLEFDKDVFGIASLNNNLILSFSNPSRIAMMTLEGKFICTVDNQKAGGEVFRRPAYLTNPTDGHIFASDCDANTVTKLDNRLVVMRTYTDPSIQSPHGIISISRDQLLVCSCHNHSVVLLNTRTGNTTVLLGEQDGLSCPKALTYCHTQRQLFVVSGWFSPIIQAYNIV